MCVCLLAYCSHPDFELILLHNRDEFYARPTEGARFWKDAPDVLAGKDLKAGGTWFGVNRKGRFGLVTNFRDPKLRRENKISRGLLVKEFLTHAGTPAAYLAGVAKAAGNYNGFNLLVGDGGELQYYSSRTGERRVLVPGIWGLSNGLFDSPWPKVVRGKALFSAVLAAGGDLEEKFFHMMVDTTPASEKALPSTGVGAETESLLSPIFVRTPTYGTRVTTIFTRSTEGKMRFRERTYTAGDTSRWTEAVFDLE